MEKLGHNNEDFQSDDNQVESIINIRLEDKLDGLGPFKMSV